MNPTFANGETLSLEVKENERLLRAVDKWYSQGLMEHASVASFAQNGIKLQSIGAPSYLLKSNYEAALDEINHAKICFTIADYYKALMNGNGDNNNTDNTVMMPSSLNSHSIDIMDDNRDTWNNIALDTAKYGCIDETISAIE